MATRMAVVGADEKKSCPAPSNELAIYLVVLLAGWLTGWPLGLRVYTIYRS